MHQMNHLQMCFSESSSENWFQGSVSGHRKVTSIIRCTPNSDISSTQTKTTRSIGVIHHGLTRSTGTRTEELLRFLTGPSRSRSRGPRPAAGARPQTRSDRTSSSPAAAETGHTVPDLQPNSFKA